MRVVTYVALDEQIKQMNPILMINLIVNTNGNHNEAYLIVSYESTNSKFCSNCLLTDGQIQTVCLNCKAIGHVAANCTAECTISNCNGVIMWNISV